MKLKRPNRRRRKPAPSSATELAPHLAAGARAEQLAERYLWARGLHTIARNYRCRAGELDLVMKDARQLVVVEIRYRRHVVPVSPVESITPNKRARIARAAERFMQEYPHFDEHQLRFDVVAMSGPLRRPDVLWLRSAFDCSEPR